MTSRFSAEIVLDAGPRTEAVFKSIQVDNSYYDGPDTVDISLDGAAIRIIVSADRVSHLRAGINSVLRLAKTSSESLESAGAAGS